MSNQIVISSGAKVRSLEGVLTGSAGIVSSVPLGGANGVATLDSSGKVPLSQLPASVVTYLGTWNAATNTPTLANGTGDVGDLYICNVAGTVNFGAGPITFAVGDWVIYNGSQWQKSAGQNGTVTSVAVTSTGNDAISITGSPITTAGTINIGFTGDNTQYINGAGDLTTFPSLTGFVPYTGATQTLDMGAFDVNARGFKVNGTAGSGHVDFKHQSGTPTGSASSTTMFADTNGNMAWKNDHNYITTLASNANTADRTYTLQNASGTLAFLTDIPSLSGYVPYTGATTNVNLGGYNLTGYTINGNQGLKVEGYAGEGGYLAFKQYAVNNLLGSGYTSISANNTNILSFLFAQSSPYDAKQFKIDVAGLTTNVWRTYTMPNADGTLALTSDIPSLANYVTTNTNQSITGIKTFTNEQLFGNGITLTGGYITYTSGSFNLTLNTNLLTANRNVFLQDKAGTIALTSDLTGGTVTSVALTAPTGFSVSGSPITSSGTLALTFATGYSLPTNASQTNWDTAYTNRIQSVSSPLAFSMGILTIQQANGSQSGFLSSTDWTTFNNKQNALTNPVTGTGTTSYHAKFTGTSTIGNSMLTDDGTTLQSIGATRSNLYLKAASSSYYSQLAFTNGSNGSFGGISYNNSGQYMQFETNSSEWMRLTNDGKLGLNNTSPNSQFEILGATGGQLTDGIRISRNTLQTSQYGVINYAAGIFNITGVNTSVGGEVRINTSDGTTVTERVRVTNAGYVGIGINSPQVLLHLYDASLPRLQFSNSTTGTASTDGFQIYQSGLTAIVTNKEAGDVVFGTSDTERMRIRANGYKTFNGPGGQDQMFSGYARAANGDYLDINTEAGGGNYQGFLIVANSYAYNAGYRTQGTHSILGRSGISVTTISQVNGGTGSSTYSISSPSDGVIRVTNTGLYGDLIVSWRGFI